MFHVSAADHQRPTHSRLHLRDARDAQIILEAVRLGILNIVSRRLNEAERTAYIKSGSVFVWEESDDELGLKRWTDGRFWSQSRMREPFLFYEERVVDRVPNEPRPSSRSAPSPAGSSKQGLVKQTYSAFVHGQGGPKPRKLHLTAYLTYQDVASLPTVDMEPALRTLAIPPGVYRSAKARSRQVDIENTYAGAQGSPVSAASSTNTTPSPSSTLPPPPPPMSPQQYAQSHYSHYPTHSPHMGYATSSARYTPYAFPAHHHSASATPSASSSPTTSLPPYYASSPTGYATPPGVLPLSSDRTLRPDEDQRIISMLNARHVV